MSNLIYQKALDRVDFFIEDVEDIKKILKQAQKQEQEHIEYSKKVQEQFSNDTKRIGEFESKIIRQERLLELYKELSNYVSEQMFAHELHKITRLKILIEELEK